MQEVLNDKSVTQQEPTNLHYPRLKQDFLQYVPNTCAQLNIFFHSIGDED